MFGSDPWWPAVLLVLAVMFVPLVYLAVLSRRDQPMQRLVALVRALAAVAEAAARGFGYGRGRDPDSPPNIR
jgi:hypothetical protein